MRPFVTFLILAVVALATPAPATAAPLPFAAELAPDLVALPSVNVAPVPRLEAVAMPAGTALLAQAQPAPGFGETAGQVIDAFQGGGWAALLDPQVMPSVLLLLLVAGFGIWKVFDPERAQKTFRTVQEIAAKLYWSIEESGRLTGLAGDQKQVMFDRAIAEQLRARGIKPKPAYVAEAKDTVLAINAKVKEARKAAPVDPSQASAQG